jgi:hypothetical protein
LGFAGPYNAVGTHGAGVARRLRCRRAEADERCVRAAPRASQSFPICWCRYVSPVTVLPGSESAAAAADQYLAGFTASSLAWHTVRRVKGLGFYFGICGKCRSLAC